MSEEKAKQEAEDAVAEEDRVREPTDDTGTGEEESQPSETESCSKYPTFLIQRPKANIGYTPQWNSLGGSTTMSSVQLTS